MFGSPEKTPPAPPPAPPPPPPAPHLCMVFHLMECPAKHSVKKPSVDTSLQAASDESSCSYYFEAVSSESYTG